MDQKILDTATIIKYHNDRIESYAIGNAQALGWHSREGQLARFDVLANIGNLAYSSILDIGCGTGDLLPHLAARYNGITYTGIDLHESFLHEAAARYKDWPNATFLHGNILDMQLPQADFVLASGTLSYRNNDPQFIYKMIGKLYTATKKALAFNLLKTINTPSPILYIYEPTTIVAFCRTLSGNVTLIDGYFEEDFTAVICI